MRGVLQQEGSSKPTRNTFSCNSCTALANYRSFPPGLWPWLRWCLVWLGTFFLFILPRLFWLQKVNTSTVRASGNTFGGQRDGAYAPGQNKRSCPVWISFLFLLLLLVKGLVLEIPHFVSCLNNAFSVVGEVFIYACCGSAFLASLHFFSAARILTTKVKIYVFRSLRREYLIFWKYVALPWVGLGYLPLSLAFTTPSLDTAELIFIFTKEKPLQLTVHAAHR